MTIDLENIKGRVPLSEYRWNSEIHRLLHWLKDKGRHTQAFSFDLVISAAYIDSTSGLEKSIEKCSNVPDQFNSHLGFINLCSACYVNKGRWTYQKAIKPQSGVLGKLSSELILSFIENLYKDFENVLAIGGAETADTVIQHKDGMLILAEVKSAPLLTYPFIFRLPDECLNGEHETVTITNTQLRDSESAVYLHSEHIIKLGKAGSDLWPFKQIVDFLISEQNSHIIDSCIEDWLDAKEAYTSKDRSKKFYYLSNASGSPPKIAKERDGWPKSESISDSKTSAGMDRTDDIKKGIYQSLKMGAEFKNNTSIKTALISNLPAYRHGADYIEPFVNMLWGEDQDIISHNGIEVINKESLRRVFDYIITLDDPILRDLEL